MITGVEMGVCEERSFVIAVCILQAYAYRRILTSSSDSVNMQSAVKTGLKVFWHKGFRKSNSTVHSTYNKSLPWLSLCSRKPELQVTISTLLLAFIRLLTSSLPRCEEEEDGIMVDANSTYKSDLPRLVSDYESDRSVP